MVIGVPRNRDISFTTLGRMIGMTCLLRFWVIGWINSSGQLANVCTYQMLIGDSNRVSSDELQQIIPFRRHDCPTSCHWERVSLRSRELRGFLELRGHQWFQKRKQSSVVNHFLKSVFVYWLHLLCSTDFKSSESLVFNFVAGSIYFCEIKEKCLSKVFE